MKHSCSPSPSPSPSTHTFLHSRLHCCAYLVQRAQRAADAVRCNFREVARDKDTCGACPSAGEQAPCSNNPAGMWTTQMEARGAVRHLQTACLKLECRAVVRVWLRVAAGPHCQASTHTCTQVLTQKHNGEAVCKRAKSHTLQPDQSRLVPSPCTHHDIAR